MNVYDGERDFLSETVYSRRLSISVQIMVNWLLTFNALPSSGTQRRRCLLRWLEVAASCRRRPAVAITVMRPAVVAAA